MAGFLGPSLFFWGSLLLLFWVFFIFSFTQLLCCGLVLVIFSVTFFIKSGLKLFGYQVLLSQSGSGPLIFVNPDEILGIFRLDFNFSFGTFQVLPLVRIILLSIF